MSLGSTEWEQIAFSKQMLLSARVGEDQLRESLDRALSAKNSRPVRRLRSKVRCGSR
ncbi:hypothetical protein [Lentzea sp.]|uniref:hypothetical protein n=1 Tax=Lentzea sp. TaxID=56099 RepID=UPI002C15E61E|nr:hypothetical protein [Lentzea sp.]HUQ59365.1 hypothetical protein [Lentzea sp.]